MSKEWEPKPLFTNRKVTETQRERPVAATKTEAYVPGALKLSQAPTPPARPTVPAKQEPTGPSVLFPTIAKFKQQLELPITDAMLAPYMPMSPEEIGLIRRLAREINFSQTKKILSYGFEAQRTLADATDTILVITEGLTASQKVKEIIAIIEGIDFDTAFAEPPTGIMGFFRGKKADPRNQFTSYSARLDTLTSDVMEQIPAILDRITLFDRAKDESKEHFKLVSAHVVAAELILAHYETKILPSLQANQSGQDILKSDEFSSIQSNVKLFQKRLNDLKIVRVAAAQSLPQLDLIKNNYVMLCTSAENAISITIPLWKRRYLAALTAFESRNTVSFESAKESLLKIHSEILQNLKTIS